MQTLKIPNAQVYEYIIKMQTLNVVRKSYFSVTSLLKKIISRGVFIEKVSFSCESIKKLAKASFSCESIKTYQNSLLAHEISQFCVFILQQT